MDMSEVIPDGLAVGKGVAQWVSDTLGINLDISRCEGIGWAKGGKIICGTAYAGWNGANVWLHTVIEKGRRMSPTYVAAMIDYPFNQLKVKRCSALIDQNNQVSRDFAQHLGAAVEGVLIDATESGNLVLYGLLKKDAQRWLTASFSQRLRSRDVRAENGKSV